MDRFFIWGVIPIHISRMKIRVTVINYSGNAIIVSFVNNALYLWKEAEIQRIKLAFSLPSAYNLIHCVQAPKGRQAIIAAFFCWGFMAPRLTGTGNF